MLSHPIADTGSITQQHRCLREFIFTSRRPVPQLRRRAESSLKSERSPFRHHPLCIAASTAEVSSQGSSRKLIQPILSSKTWYDFKGQSINVMNSLQVSSRRCWYLEELDAWDPPLLQPC